jgi:hypothetical protein
MISWTLSICAGSPYRANKRGATADILNPFVHTENFMHYNDDRKTSGPFRLCHISGNKAVVTHGNRNRTRNQADRIRGYGGGSYRLNGQGETGCDRTYGKGPTRNFTIVVVRHIESLP